MAGMHLLCVVCLAGPWMASAYRQTQRVLSDELEGGVVASNVSAMTLGALGKHCKHELKALAKSVEAKRQIPHNAVAKFVGGMLDMQGVAAHAYGVPNSIGDIDCAGMVERVFEAAESGWLGVQGWKAKCSDPSSCIFEGLAQVGLTPDQLTDEDWGRLITDFYLLYNSDAADCQGWCDEMPACRECKAIAQGDSCPMYAEQETCRYTLMRIAMCPCIKAFTDFLESELYANTLKSLEQEMKVNIPKEDNSVINRECLAKPKGADLKPVGVTVGGTMVSGSQAMQKAREIGSMIMANIDSAMGVRGAIYLDDPSEGAACAPGYTCQPSNVWRSEYIGHYGAPLLIGITYAAMKVAEFTIVVAASHALCGPAWMACWTTYATSIPASEIAMAGVVAMSKPIMTRKAVTCLPTPCMHIDGQCVVPGEDPTDHTQLIPGLKCTPPKTDEEAEALKGQCKLSFCSHHELLEGPSGGSLWHCAEGRSNLDPGAASLAARAARARASQANICEDDGIDHEAQIWFNQEFEEFRSGGESCIKEGLDEFGIHGSGVTAVLGQEDVLYDLFEATRLRKGAVCAKGCPGVPSLVKAKCMTDKMPVSMVRGVWKKHQEGRTEGCKAAILKVFLCKCAEKYGKPATSHRSLSQATEAAEQRMSSGQAFSESLS